MLNYVKSEFYRISHTSMIPGITGLLAGLAFMLNMILFLFDKNTDGFRYGTVSFSLSNLTAGMVSIFFVGMVMVSLMFTEEKKNGILKNAIAFGISREKIFFGKCLVSTVVSVCSLIIILVVYIGSAVLLLEPGVEPDAVMITLRGVAAVLIMAVACEVLAIAFLTYFEKEISGYIMFIVIIAFVPGICRIIGLKYELVGKIAAWMPYNYLNNMGGDTVINMSGWSCIWETPEGMLKCLISGMVSLIAFFILGLCICKKQEV